MPDNQIERFFSLLEQSLGSSPRRRQDVTDELRDHVHQHVEEAAGRGLSRSEAIGSVLHEFGDAAHLAVGLRRAGLQSQLTRCLGRGALPIAALAAIIVTAVVLWSDARRRSASSQAACESESTEPSVAESLAGQSPPVPGVNRPAVPSVDNTQQVAPLELGAEVDSRSDAEDRSGVQWLDVVRSPLGDRDACAAAAQGDAPSPPAESEGV